MRYQGLLVSMLGSLLTATVCGAQAQNAEAEAQARAIQQNAITDRYLTPVQAEMVGKVDTRNAAPGQEVDVKLRQAATLADGTALPRGARLVGHVIQSKVGGPERGSAILVLIFDQAEVRPGQRVPVRCVIRTVAQNAGALAEDRRTIAAPLPAVSDAYPLSRGGVAGGMPGTVPTVGGAGTGGVGTGARAGLPGTSGPVGGGTRGSGVPSITNSRSGTGGGAADIDSLQAAAVASANQKVLEAGDSVRGAPHSTGLPGVLLWAAPTASGTLTAMGRNIDLETGTQMTLGVIAR